MFFTVSGVKDTQSEVLHDVLEVDLPHESWLMLVEV